MTPPVQALLLQHLGSTSCSYPSAPTSLAPYGETGPFYAQMRREILSLINACMQVRHTSSRLLIVVLVLRNLKHLQAGKV
jgi:hypothetical protein